MSNVSNGEHDSMTSHRIWMGSLFFMECVPCPLYDKTIIDEDHDVDVVVGKKKNEDMIQLLIKWWKKRLFPYKYIVELGAG